MRTLRIPSNKRRSLSIYQEKSKKKDSNNQIVKTRWEKIVLLNIRIRLLIWKF